MTKTKINNYSHKVKLYTQINRFINDLSKVKLDKKSFKELEKTNLDPRWKSNTDTETLLEALEFWGIEKTLKKISGMFAFGVWDKKNRSLTLARDRMGEKPLYFGWQGKGDNKVFLFGSELKALKAHPEFNRKIYRGAIALQLRHNCIPDPYSIYEDIYKLLPGNYLQLQEDSLKKGLLPVPKVYWSLTESAIFGSNNQLKISEQNHDTSSNPVLVDVGSGYGMLLDEAQATGRFTRVTGIEPNKDTQGKLGPAAITFTPFNSLAFDHCFTVPRP